MGNPIVRADAGRSPQDGGPNRVCDPLRRLSRGGRTLPAPVPGGASRRVGQPASARGTFSTACTGRLSCCHGVDRRVMSGRSHLAGTGTGACAAWFGSREARGNEATSKGTPIRFRAGSGAPTTPLSFRSAVRRYDPCPFRGARLSAPGSSRGNRTHDPSRPSFSSLAEPAPVRPDGGVLRPRSRLLHFRRRRDAYPGDAARSADAAFRLFRGTCVLVRPDHGGRPACGRGGPDREPHLPVRAAGGSGDEPGRPPVFLDGSPGRARDLAGGSGGGRSGGAVVGQRVGFARGGRAELLGFARRSRVADALSAGRDHRQHLRCDGRDRRDRHPLRPRASRRGGGCDSRCHRLLRAPVRAARRREL